MFDLLGIKKSVKALGDQVKALEAQIEKLKTERQELEDAPLGAGDVLSVMSAFIDREAEAYPALVDQSLERFRGGHPLAQYQSLKNNDRNMRPAEIVNVKPAGRIDDDGVYLQRALFYLFGDAIKEKLAEVVEKKFPKQRMTAEQKIRRVAEIGTEIERREKELAEIRAAAREAGVRIKGQPRETMIVTEGKRRRVVEVD